ncbi:MAG: hypothetical protein MR013_02240 [Prevotella sp.]|nr:hypothetical protein [Prevotella sp.]
MENKDQNNADLIADKLRADGKERKRKNTRRINNWWLWFGVIILIFILVWWLWTIGIFGDMSGSFNGN